MRPPSSSRSFLCGNRPFSLPPRPLSPSLSVDVIAFWGLGDAVAVWGLGDAIAIFRQSPCCSPQFGPIRPHPLVWADSSPPSFDLGRLFAPILCAINSHPICLTVSCLSRAGWSKHQGDYRDERCRHQSITKGRVRTRHPEQDHHDNGGCPRRVLRPPTGFCKDSS